MLENPAKTINHLFIDNFKDITGQYEDRKATKKMANKIQIKSYCDSDKQVWDDFILNNGNSSFFHLIGWKDIIEQTFGHKSHYIMALSENQVKGVLPLFELKNRLFGHALVSIPFVVYGGVCAADKNTESMLLKSASILGRLTGVDYVELRNEFDSLPVKSDRQNWLTKNLYTTFQREIYPDIESNFNAIPRKQRRMIKQGSKAGLISKIGGGEYLSDFYRLYSINKKNLGTPVFPIKYFENIIKIFPQTFILSVWKDNIMVAAVMTFIFKDRLMPYFSGALKEYFRYAANDFMYWELMRYGCEEGYKFFDFGRSKKGTGSYDFKRHWGFEPKDLPYTYYLVAMKDMPNISPVNPKYSAMVNIWKKLPLFVANWLGPKIVRNIP